MHNWYINGYPDGSVRAEGNITRAETAVVLYRVRNTEADVPYSATGEVFPDVTDAHWADYQIEYMDHTGVVRGYEDGTYRPDSAITRAEFAALVRRFIGIEEKSGESYPDVDEEQWYSGEIKALSDEGFIEGYEDGRFYPERPITRAEAMRVINKVLGRAPSEEYVKSLAFRPYNDLAENEWYYTDVIEATITHDYTLEDGLEVRWSNYE